MCCNIPKSQCIDSSYVYKVHAPLRIKTTADISVILLCPFHLFVLFSVLSLFYLSFLVYLSCFALVLGLSSMCFDVLGSEWYIHKRMQFTRNNSSYCSRFISLFLFLILFSFLSLFYLTFYLFICQISAIYARYMHVSDIYINACSLL